MATSTAKPSEPAAAALPPAPAVPPLENGDRLTRDEFERRYDAMPGLKKAELIEGVVYMPSPVRLRHHGRPHSKLIALLGNYATATPGTDTASNGSIRLDMDNMPQPDGFLLILPSHGGRAQISEDDYVERGPELVAEVAASTVSFDLHTRLPVYRRNEVQEYIVWRVEDQAVDWFVLRDQRYERLLLGPGDIYRSEVFPGLWVDPVALVREDMQRVTEILSQGLATPEHATFVAQLQARAAAAPA
jgi:hypothetical protein